MTGEWPSSEIDHCNLNKDDNRWTNLRLATRSQNTAYCNVKVAGILGVRGVSMDHGKYRARIMKDGKSIALGHFATLGEARAAYDAAQKKLFGEFAYAR